MCEVRRGHVALPGRRRRGQRVLAGAAPVCRAAWWPDDPGRLLPDSRAQRAVRSVVPGGGDALIEERGAARDGRRAHRPGDFELDGHPRERANDGDLRVPRGGRPGHRGGCDRDLPRAGRRAAQLQRDHARTAADPDSALDRLWRRLPCFLRAGERGAARAGDARTAQEGCLPRHDGGCADDGDHEPAAHPLVDHSAQCQRGSEPVHLSAGGSCCGSVARRLRRCLRFATPCLRQQHGDHRRVPRVRRPGADGLLAPCAGAPEPVAGDPALVHLRRGCDARRDHHRRTGQRHPAR